MGTPAEITTMKFAAVATLFIHTVLASPSGVNGRVAKRQEAATDELLFSISLPDFIARRKAQNPPELDWSSDSCSSSPDNPLGFPFDRRFTIDNNVRGPVLTIPSCLPAT